ncbi:MAG TPA: HAMP domain-containing sensor histidine kinase, partial [Acidimicrobiia bacterium]|nr:HAMP domain-containing sensor histidine kinase [Acidimicrobiia bacterium]
ADLDEVVSERTAFWAVLAEEQERKVTLDIGHDAGRVPLSADDVAVVVDTLVGNVFSHTAPGVPFAIRTGRDGEGTAWLEVADGGPGFGEGTVLERGVSGSGSTGLGLDIVSKTVGAVGGRLDVDDRPEGGAVVRVSFG